MCSLVGMVMKVCGVKLLWSTPGCNSHSCQPLSCSATARQKDAEGSGRLKNSLPYSRAKNPARNAWSVWRMATMGSFCCCKIMGCPLSGGLGSCETLSPSWRDDSSTTRGGEKRELREWRNWQTSKTWDGFQ